MIRTLCAEICSAIILAVPANGHLTRRLLENLRAGLAGNDARNTQCQASKATYCLGDGRGLRSSLFLNVGE